MNNHNKSSELGIAPPQSIDAEITVLGAILLSPSSIFEISDKLTSEAFYVEKNQLICSAIQDLYNENKRIDSITVSEQLKKKNSLDAAGGVSYLNSLMSSVASASHIKEHYFLVYGQYIKREVIRVASNLQSGAFDEGSDPDDLIDFMNTQIDEINEKNAGGRLSAHISTFTKGCEESLKARENAVKQGRMRGIPTPWKRLNELLQGWQPGLIFIGARPSIGKTAIALAIGEAAAKSGAHTNIFSLETSGIRLTDRLLLAKSDMQPGNFRSGYMSAKDWVEFNKAKEQLNMLPIYIDDNPYVGFNYLKTRLRIMKKKGMCKLAIFDYLQLSSVDDNKNRDRSLGEFTRKCKNLAQELDMPIILLCQLNREAESRPNKKPEVSDIRETGSAEGDADVIILLHRPERYGITSDRDGDHKGKIYLLLRKQKDGPTGDITLAVNESLTKFKDYVDVIPSAPTSNRDRQLPQEKEEFEDQLPF